MVPLDLTNAKLDDTDLRFLSEAARLTLEQQRMTFQEYADTLTKLNEYAIRHDLSYGAGAVNTTDKDDVDGV